MNKFLSTFSPEKVTEQLLELSDEQLTYGMAYPKEILFKYILGEMEEHAKSNLEKEFTDNASLLAQAIGMNIAIDQYNITNWEDFEKQRQRSYEEFRKRISRSL